MKKLFLLSLLVLFGFAHAQAGQSAQGVFVLNSNSWQDAIIASQYAYASGQKFKYILGNEELNTLVQEVYGLRVSEAQLYYRQTSALPAIGISLRSLNLRVKDTEYKDHHDLARLLVTRFKPQTVIIARDDFALDAISSTYLARSERGLIVFSQGVLGPKQEVIDAIRQAGVKRVFVVGAVEEDRIKQLKDLEVIVLRGRDEFENTRIVNEYAFKKHPPIAQSLVTTGEIIENSILYSHEYPIYVVPELSVYSLTQLITLLNKTKTTVVVGIGQSVVNPGEIIRAAGMRFIVKLTKLRPQQSAAFVRQDLLNILNGYRAPLPNYTFSLVSLEPDYSDLFGVTTGNAVIFDLAEQITENKPAPPVTVKATLQNDGNIEVPVSMVIRVLDADNQAVAVLNPETVVIPPKERRTVKVLWADPASQGKYTLQANMFADVYEGISKEGTPVAFDLLWLNVWINLLLLVIAALIGLMIMYYSRKLRKGAREEDSVTKTIADEVDKIGEKIEKKFKPSK